MKIIELLKALDLNELEYRSFLFYNEFLSYKKYSFKDKEEYLQSREKIKIGDRLAYSNITIFLDTCELKSVSFSVRFGLDEIIIDKDLNVSHISNQIYKGGDSGTCCQCENVSEDYISTINNQILSYQQAVRESNYSITSYKKADVTEDGKYVWYDVNTNEKICEEFLSEDSDTFKSIKVLYPEELINLIIEHNDKFFVRGCGKVNDRPFVRLYCKDINKDTQ